MNKGDRVFIIQRLAGRESCFYLCGEYEITGHSINHELTYPYRFAPEDISHLGAFLLLDPLTLSERLPLKDNKVVLSERAQKEERYKGLQGKIIRKPKIQVNFITR